MSEITKPIMLDETGKEIIEALKGISRHAETADMAYDSEKLGGKEPSEYLGTGDVPEWAKQPNKPTYTASEVGALPSDGKAVDSDKLTGHPASDFATTATVTALADDLTREISRAKETEEVLKSRIDTITSLPEGSTTGDAELQDIRVKADGTTATSAGNAVREQVSELKGDLGYKAKSPSEWFSGTAILSSNGGTATSAPFANYSSTDYLYIEGWLYDSIKIRSRVVNSLVGYAFYDISKTFISGGDLPSSSSLQDLIISVPTNATYLRFCCMTDSINNSFWQLTSSIESIINNLSAYNYVTPQLFGAKGDGVTDDYAAFVKASKVSGSLHIDLRIPFSEDGYIIDASNFTNDSTSVRKGIPIYSNQKIIGDGARIKIKQGSLVGNSAILYSHQYKTASYDDQAPIIYDIEISGITIEGDESDLESSYSMTGIAINKCNNLVVENVNIINMSGITGEGYGIIFAFCNQVSMIGCNIDRTDRSNVYVWETQNFYARNCKLKDSYFRDNFTISTFSPKKYQDSSVDIRFCDCVNTLGTGTHSIRFSGDSTGIIESCNIIGTTVTTSPDTSGFDGIYVTSERPQNVIIRNNTIKTCTYGIRIESLATKIIRIENNRILNCVDGIRSTSANATFFIISNIIKDSEGVPMYILGAYYATVDKNMFDGIPQTIYISPTINLILSNNIFRNYTAISPGGYLVIISEVEWAMIVFNRSYYSTAKMRVLSNGVAIGNHCGFDSDTLAVNEFNV